MINTKLIFVDGITGSGKSTTAHFISRQLEKNGIKAKWIFEEENDHPFPSIPDNGDIDDYFEKFLISVQKFVNDALNDDKVFVIESFFFQAILLKAIFQDCSKTKIEVFYNNYCEIIASLNPVFIYLFQNDIETAIKKNWNTRGDFWKNHMINRTDSSQYLKNLNIFGENGFFKFWNKLNDCAIHILQETKYKKLLINNSSYDWNKYRKDIIEFLDLKLYPEILFEDSYQRYCGYYSGITIRIEENRLVADWWLPNYKLIPVNQDEFEFESLPISFKFLEDNNNITAMKFVKSEFYGCKVGEEKVRFDLTDLNEAEMIPLCGNYFCEKEMLYRRIYLKNGGLFYWRDEKDETRLLAVNNKKFVMNGGYAVLTFELKNNLKSFILTASGQNDMTFYET